MSIALTSEGQTVRVAIISPSFGGYGGMEAFVLTILSGLPVTARLEVRVFFKRTKGFVLRPELAAAIAAIADRVAIVEAGSVALAKAVAWADVVHLQNTSPDVAVLARLCGKPLLLTLHAHRVPGRSWRQRLWDLSLRQATRRFFVSEFVRRTWEGEARRAGSEVVFPICELASGALPPTQRRGFAFAARWIPNKGIETLIEAYARAAVDPVAWPLRLIGDGPLRPQVERRLAELGLRGVELLGFVSQEKKAEVIRAARWMVVPPQTREDFGLTAIEARHLEVPCIITRDGGVPEAAGAEALACEPADVEGLAACLRAAAAMDEREYAARAQRTRATLLPRLAGPSFYADVYQKINYA